TGEPLGPLELENDLGSLNGKRPFEPFGPQPEAGALLWAAHTDLQNKRLRAIKLRLDWMGGPTDLNVTYAAYQLPKPFSGKASLVDGPMIAAQGGNRALFTTDANRQDASKPQTLEIATVSDSVQPYSVPSPSTAPASARERPHALRLELVVGFGH